MSALFAEYEPRSRGTVAKVEVKPLSRANLDECVALAVQREGGDEDRWKASLERSLNAGDRTAFVALLEGHVAGYGTVGWFAPGRVEAQSAIPDGWYLLGLVVDPGCRRQSVGQQLTALRLDWLRIRADRAWYFVSSANRPSIDLHSKLGFQMVASDIEIPGITFTESGQLYAADLA